eukprot:3563063-Prymnesium_polylepis.1
MDIGSRDSTCGSRRGGRSARGRTEDTIHRLAVFLLGDTAHDVQNDHAISCQGRRVAACTLLRAQRERAHPKSGHGRQNT